MLLSQTSTTAKKEYSYDEYLRLNEVKETVLTDGKSFIFGYQYDSYGRLAKEIYPHAIGETDNSTLEYKYDDYGYPVKKYLGTSLIWEAKQYSEQGQLSKYILGNNITVTKEFDNQGRLTNITGLKGSNTYQNMSYGYRGDGNMHYRTDATSGVNKKEWFKYDTQNRLIGWETTSLNAAEPEYQTRISYEGNRISQKENIGNYGYSGFPHHGVKSSGVTTITNNALGISYDHNTIDGRARVSSIISGNNSVTYTHGTSDELIKKTETKNGNTYTTYYAGGGKYELRIDNNNVETKLSYLGSGVVKYDTPGTTEDKILYLLKDHLGSVVKVLSINNNSITVEESFSYDVWGNRRNATTWATTNITTPRYIYKGFTGHEHIEGFGLIHMKGRVYDPALGLFLSPDPYVQSMTAQGFNRYSYCMGNPLMYTDPDGEWVQYVMGAIMGGISGWQLAKAAGLEGWAMFGSIMGGAAIGAATAGLGTYLSTTISTTTSFGTAIGSGLGAAMTTSFVTGATNSLGFGLLNASITGEWNVGTILKNTGIGALSGLVGSGLGAGIGGPMGAFIGGAASSAVGSALTEGSRKDILNAATMGGIASVIGYEIQMIQGYANYSKGDKPLGELKYCGYHKTSVAVQRSFAWNREVAGWLLDNGKVSGITYLGKRSGILPDGPDNALEPFHTHQGVNLVYEWHGPGDFKDFRYRKNHVIGWDNIYTYDPDVNLYKPIPYTYEYIRNTYIPSILQKNVQVFNIAPFFLYRY